MVKIKPIKKTTKLDLEQYVNHETGELLSSQKVNTSVLVLEETDYVEVIYTDYVNIDGEALMYIKKTKLIGTTDLGHVISLANYLCTEYNALLRDSKALTIEEISSIIDITYDKARLLVNRLIKKGIMYKFSGYRNDKPFQAFLLNPFLVRKRKNVHKGCLNLFEPLRVDVQRPSRKRVGNTETLDY